MGENSQILDLLQQYFKRYAPELGVPRSLEKCAGGQSNPTYRLKTMQGQFALRMKPPGQLLKSAHAVDREFRVMQALADSSVPVPKVHHLCLDEASPFERAFFIMEWCDGAIYWDPALPEQTSDARAAIYKSMGETLAGLHNTDFAKIGLTDFGRPGNYFERQVSRWTAQYAQSKTSDNRDMDAVADWLMRNTPEDDGHQALVHGDYRLDNLVICPVDHRVLAVLDWELSTLGHPLADLAYQCMQLRLPYGGKMRGLRGIDRAELGLPSEEEYVASYCDRRNIARPGDWEFYLVFSFFRLAAILDGVVRRSLDGNGSNPEIGKTYASVIPVLAHSAAELMAGKAK